MAKKTIAFQGALGAYSDIACRNACPDYETLPCETFHRAFEAVQTGKAQRAMIPIENTLAGRVADVHHLIPNSGLTIVGEHFEPIRHNLIGMPSASLSDIKHIHSHIHALPQCRKIIDELSAKPHVESDTAGAARMVSKMNDKSHAAISSSLAAEIYNLEILKKDVQDDEHNTTRFVIFEKDPERIQYKSDKDYITSCIYSVRSIPAALYKALGGFATNGVNLIKLESYVDKKFNKARFYQEVEGHTDDPSVQLAFEELGFYASELTILGSYEAHSFRKTQE